MVASPIINWTQWLQSAYSFSFANERRDGKYVDKFIKRKDIEKLFKKYVFVCEKHFDTKYLSPTKNRTRLLMHLTIYILILTIFSGFQKNLPASVLPKVDNLRRFRTEKRICLNKRNLFQNWKMMKTTVLKILYITSVESWCRFHFQNIWVPRTIFFSTVIYAQKW